MFYGVEWAEPGIEECDLYASMEDALAHEAYIMYNQEVPADKDSAMTTTLELPKDFPPNQTIRFHVTQDVWYELERHFGVEEYITIHFMVGGYELPVNTPFWNELNSLPRIDTLIEAMNCLRSFLSSTPIRIHNEGAVAGPAAFHVTQDIIAFSQYSPLDPTLDLQIQWTPGVAYHEQLADVVVDTLHKMREEIVNHTLNADWVPF